MAAGTGQPPARRKRDYEVDSDEVTMERIDHAFCHQEGKPRPLAAVVRVCLPRIKGQVRDVVEAECRIRASRAEGDAAAALNELADWIKAGAR